MGKKGDLHRKMKKQQATYTFTGEELEEHDRGIRAAYREHLDGRMIDSAKQAAAQWEKEAIQHVDDHWKKIEAEFYGPDDQENFNNLLSYMMAISARVLIERFGWKPVPRDGNYDNRNRMVQFANAVVAELDRISNDQKMDIRTYSKETFEKYGVSFANVVPEEDA